MPRIIEQFGSWFRRRGQLTLFGPVLFYDLVSVARRGRYALLRGIYGLAMLLTLFVVYRNYEQALGPAGVNTSGMADFAQAFFFTFISVQFLAVLLLTPAYTAGAIAEEKDRQTLEFLLASDLRNGEIVLSKLLARVATLALLIMTGLPVLSLTQLWGGVDPNLVIASFAITALTLASLGSVSILNSVYCQKPRDAIILTYMTTAAYLGLSLLSGVLITSRTYVTLSIRAGLDPVIVKDAIGWFSAGNIVSALIELRDTFYRNVPLTTVLRHLVRNYAVVHIGVTLLCSTWAVFRLRTVALRQARRPLRRPQRLGQFRRWCSVGRQPVVWKELFAEPGLNFNRFGRFLFIFIALASFVPAVWIGAHWFWQEWQAGWSPWSWFRLGQATNLWVRVVGTVVACLTLVGVAARAASSVSGERERQTLDPLLTTPLDSSTILGAKWLGSILSLRWAWIWLCVVWTCGLLTGGLDIVTLPWLLLSCSVYAGCVAALGIFFSTRGWTTLRATMATLAMAAAVTLGHWLIWVVLWVPSRSRPMNDPVADWVMAFQLYGLTPPVSIAWLSFRGIDFELPVIGYDRDPARSLMGLVLGLCLWSLAAGGLWYKTAHRFRKQTNRVPQLVGAAVGGKLPAQAATMPKAVTRPRWRKRVLAGTLFLIAAVVPFGLRFAYLSHSADLLLQETVSEIDKEDQGWRAEHSSWTVTPDQLNAVSRVLTAHQLLPQSTDVETDLRHLLNTLQPEIQLSEQEMGRVESELRGATAALHEIAALTTRRSIAMWRQKVEASPMPLLGVSKRVAFWLNLDIVRHAQDGDADIAATSCQRLFKVGCSIGDQPRLDPQLTRRLVSCQALRAVERVLAQGEPSEDCLAPLQELYDNEASHPALLLGLRGERAYWNVQFEANQSVSGAFAGGLRYMVDRWIRPDARASDQVALLRYLSQWVLLASNCVDNCVQEAATGKAVRDEPAFLRQLEDPVGLKIELLCQREAELRCGLTMIALERFRRRFGHWPTDLDDLLSRFSFGVRYGTVSTAGKPVMTIAYGPTGVPLFLTDPYDGAPLRYRQLDDGVVIYSIGPDGLDNGGKLDRQNAGAIGVDLGFRLWDVDRRRQPASSATVGLPRYRSDVRTR
jgi:ABC-type transport system involved in multi-copper enzyme maturation permease subunit